MEIENPANQHIQLHVWLTFVTSFLLSPWNLEFFTFFAALVIYEVVSYAYCRYCDKGHNLKYRLLIVVSSLMGWLTGQLFIKIIYAVLKPNS